MNPRKKQGPRPRPESATPTVREVTRDKNGRTYRFFRVEGIKDPNGKRVQRDFKTRELAMAFAATHAVATLNRVPLNTVTTTLTREQVSDAENAIRRLGGRGTLEEAIEFYLGRAAPPENPIAMREALPAFLAGKDQDGRRKASLITLKSTVTRFITFCEGKGIVNLHDAADSHLVADFLAGVRAKNGIDRATPKTRRNYRLDLSSFFGWCAKAERRWIRKNPCEDMTDDTLVDEGAPPTCLSIREAARMMRDAATFAEGKLCRYMALALFAGIRPGSNKDIGELRRLHQNPGAIDLAKGIIEIQGLNAKDRRNRKIVIRPNLHKWLEATEGEPILPINHDRLLKDFRKRHNLTHDVLRHSFISYHVSAFRSVGDAALESGNSEAVIKKSYLNQKTSEQGKAFWRISPKGSRIWKTDPEKIIELSKIA